MSLWYNRTAWNLTGFLLLLAWFSLLNGWRLTLLVLSAAAVHELGHLLALKLVGGGPVRLELSPFGAVMRISGLGLSYPRELAAVLAGPGANFLMGGALLLAGPAHETAAGANWVLGCFNLLPAAPLDGWRAMQLVLSWLLGPDRGAAWASALGGAGGILLGSGILWLMLRSGGNLWLLPAAAGVGAAGVRTWLSSGESGKIRGS